MSNAEFPAGSSSPGRKPEWLKIKIRGGENLAAVNSLLSRCALHTVCREANCPNRMECYANRTAAFMILGAVCTRNCAFCNVTQGQPEPVDSGEAGRIAEAAGRLGLRYVVITSVTRDDLPDGGASGFAAVTAALKSFFNKPAGGPASAAPEKEAGVFPDGSRADAPPEILVELLVPDFQGDPAALRTVVDARPDIINHNIETVPRLYPAVRPRAVYERSLRLLEQVKKTSPSPPGRGIRTKSGLMVGLGETREEVKKVFQDLREAGCDFLTVGQYLAPSARHYPVAEYIHPGRFEEYRRYALSLGFSGVAAGPFVRSSYRASRLAAGE
jgi:lipoic acid synthetase